MIWLGEMTNLEAIHTSTHKKIRGAPIKGHIHEQKRVTFCDFLVCTLLFTLLFVKRSKLLPNLIKKSRGMYQLTYSKNHYVQHIHFKKK